MALPEADLFQIWNYEHSSGGGSTGCGSYQEFVKNFIKERGVKTVVELGCGDWQVGGGLDYGEASVVALDASKKHIERLARENKKENLKFVHGDIRSFDDSSFDLAIIKDVIQHWPTGEIQEWLRKPHARLMLITNDKNGGTVNGDIGWEDPGNKRDGNLRVPVRAIDLAASPFYLSGKNVFEANGKVAFLLERMG